MLSIRSTTSNRALEIRKESDGYLSVHLHGHPVTALTVVWVETGDVHSLVEFFSELGHSEGPWNGAKQWCSLEDDFRLNATCSSLGSVTFQVAFSGLQGAPEEWRVVAGLETELGQLEGLAASAHGLAGADDET